MLESGLSTVRSLAPMITRGSCIFLSFDDKKYGGYSQRRLRRRSAKAADATDVWDSPHSSIFAKLCSDLNCLKMRVLGIDPGSETLGWGVVDGAGSRYSLVEFGTVRSNRKDAFSRRLLNIYNGVADIVGRFSPDV